MGTRPPRLKFLHLNWFGCVMGLAGLALAWLAAAPVMGEGATAAALGLGLLAALVFAVLLAATLWRALRLPQALADDLRHPVRHAFIAALPISLLALVGLAVALLGPAPWLLGLWALGSCGQALATLWVVARWWAAAPGPGLGWAQVTPALFLPSVGNVLVPLAGLPLGQGVWSAAQFGIGAMFWPLVLGLLLVRLVLQAGLLDRVRPLLFICVAPPALLGLGLQQFGAPGALVWALWGMAAFTLLWVGTQLRAVIGQPFGLAHWALSFPLAAFTALTLRLAAAADGGALRPLAVLLLALLSLLSAALVLATVRGLRDGTLLAPETVATLAPAA